jgi:hypothetical protein
MKEVINTHLLQYPKHSIVNLLDYGCRGIVKAVYVKESRYGKKYHEFLVSYKVIDNNISMIYDTACESRQLSLVAKDMNSLDKTYKCKHCGGLIGKKYLDYKEDYIDLCESCLVKLYRRTSLGTSNPAKRYPLSMLFGKNERYFLLSEKSQYKFCDACDIYYKGYHECRDRNGVQSYHTQNPLKFYKESNELKPRYFGVEHETNKRSDFNSDFSCDNCPHVDDDGERDIDCSDCEERTNPLNIIARDLMHEFPNLYVQYDGSISGFEVIFQPMTLKVWNKFNIRKYLNILDGLTASEGTGIHVHVNRESVSKLTIYKVNEFFRVNQRLIYKFFERTGDEQSWCKITDKDTNKMLYRRQYQMGEKYQIVNTGKDNTIEFRGFRSTMTAYKFLARIEFCDFILNYFETNASYDFVKFYNTGLNCKYENLRRYFETMQAKIF